jgi:transcriptional regulator with XRE-family HTH domain
MTEIELKTFGERVTWLLRRRRQANQDIASQKELAAKIGMKPQQLNAYMSGRRAPNVRHLRAIAAALETSVSFLALTSNNSEPDSSEVLPDEADADLAWASTTNTIANELDRWPACAAPTMRSWRV